MGENTTANELAKRTYADRRLIAVSNNAILQAAEDERKRQAAAAAPDSWDWRSLANAAMGIATRVSSFEVTAARVLVNVGIEAYKAISTAREEGAPIRSISFEAASQLSFPPGHPREGVVYVCHPVIPNTYYTMADFHRVVFEHKFAEAMLLIMSLGAVNMRVEHILGWSKEFAASLNVNLPSAPLNLGGGVSQTAGAGNRVLFSASLRGAHAPELPRGLAWFEHEAMWKGIARGRMDFGLSDFNLAVSYKDDYGIDSKLSALIQGAGLEIGGKFESHQATIWQIEGSFGNIADRPDATFVSVP